MVGVFGCTGESVSAPVLRKTSLTCSALLLGGRRSFSGGGSLARFGSLHTNAAKRAPFAWALPALAQFTWIS